MIYSKFQIGFYLVLFIFGLRCQSGDQNHLNPAPTEFTKVNHQDEGEENYKNRELWVELVHGGKNSDWRSIEAENRMESFQYGKNNVSSRGDDEWVAGGNILGKWIERGSNNNAGNIMVVDYDPDDESVYAVGGGGPMFKGDFSGIGWQVVNDKLRFSTNLLKLLKLNNGKKRIISALEGIPHYSDDSGKTWQKSMGVTPTTNGWNLFDSKVTKSGIIFFLAKRDYWSNIKVYYSEDNGQTYKSPLQFATSDTRNIALGMNEKNDEIFVIEQKGANKSNLHQFDKLAKTMKLISQNQDIGFGEKGRANLQVVIFQDTTMIYAYNHEQKLHVSKDLGQSWKILSTLPSTPWDVGLFVSPSDPRKMIYGEVNAYRSINGGISWSKINEWWEYYKDIYTKLHADIMTIREFEDADGNPFILNGNHGGLNISDDYGESHFNIGLYGLNVSQYYDVKTYPYDLDIVFAGTQDQGLQRGAIFGENTSELFQNISGDYGHLTFSGNGKHLWTVYPGGSIGFYSDPLTQDGPIKGYEIDSKKETVWIPPVILGPDASKDIVLAAGGSIDSSSSGSYIIQLEYKNGNVIPTQLPFDFSSSGGTISAMAIHSLDKNIWFVATTNGHFYKSIDRGQVFKRQASFLSESHYLYGSCVLPSKVNPNTVYISGNGYNNSPVYKSVDGGLTFSDYSSGLPKTTVFKIVANEDESLIFAATENGPYVYVKSKAMWFSLSGLKTPSQTYWSVEYLPHSKTVRFGTYGRGIWDFNVKEILSKVTETTSLNLFEVYPNPADDFINISTRQDYLLKTIRLLDINGMEVLRQNGFNSTRIDIGKIKSGTYVVELTSAIGKQNKKIIISH